MKKSNIPIFIRKIRRAFVYLLYWPSRTYGYLAGLHKLKKYGEPQSKMIFILGTGRSGTHWLGYILGAHEDIELTVEKPPLFTWITRMAIDERQELILFPKLVNRYKIEHALFAPKIYLDKSHPNIWLAEKLAEAFPNAYFVGIKRNVFATVSSMLQHSDVWRWHLEWRKYPVPNRFLGITSEVARDYEKLSLSAQCAIRWVAHMERFAKLEVTLGDRLCLLDYEQLQLDTQQSLQRLQEFLGLETEIPRPHIKKASLTKWEDELTEQDQEEIRAIVGNYARAVLG